MWMLIQCYYREKVKNEKQQKKAEEEREEARKQKEREEFYNQYVNAKTRSNAEEEESSIYRTAFNAADDKIRKKLMKDDMWVPDEEDRAAERAAKNKNKPPKQPKVKKPSLTEVVHKVWSLRVTLP